MEEEEEERGEGESLGIGGREGGGEEGKEWFPWEPQMTRRPALRGIRAPSPTITTKVLLVLSTLVKPAVYDTLECYDKSNHHQQTTICNQHSEGHHHPSQLIISTPTML